MITYTYNRKTKAFKVEGADIQSSFFYDYPKSKHHKRLGTQIALPNDGGLLKLRQKQRTYELELFVNPVYLEELKQQLSSQHNAKAAMHCFIIRYPHDVGGSVFTSPKLTKDKRFYLARGDAFSDCYNPQQLALLGYHELIENEKESRRFLPIINLILP